jgi:glyoxylase-like metal-dependent hydrolase (beta-lactamase superfamily II)
MKLILICTVFIHSLLAFEYSAQPVKVGAATHCFFGVPEVMDEHNNGNIANSCFVNMGDSYLVIDSGPTYSYAKQAYTKMKEIQNLPISYVINTHTHDDHWLGNGYYKEIGVNIIGSKEFKKEVKQEKTRMQMKVSPEAYAKTEQVFPNEFVDGEKLLTLNDIKVYITCVNKKAHSNSDLFVYIPKYSTVFTGDLIFNERIPSLRDGNLKNWLEALEKIKSLNAEFIIGGHGKIVDKKAPEATYKYLQEMKQEVSSAIADAKDIEDAVNEIKMDAFKNFKLYDVMHRQNIEAAYRMLEWEDE